MRVVCPLLEPQESPLPNNRRYALQPWDGSRTQQLRGGTPDRNHALLSSLVVISWSIDGSIFSVGRSCSGGRACAVDHLEPPSAAQCHLVQSGGLPVRGFFRLLAVIRSRLLLMLRTEKHGEIDGCRFFFWLSSWRSGRRMTIPNWSFSRCVRGLIHFLFVRVFLARFPVDVVSSVVVLCF